ncbi:MAG: hypothetical protein K2Y25_14470, partial [Pseudomonadaceae bacterium]|nr:hypothetical protein [Pseudomonadaceae bacterium]
AAASPTLRAGAWVTPALLIHGSADGTIAAQQSTDFAAVIGAAVITVAGADHSFAVFGDPLAALPASAKSVFDFIDGATEK